MSVQALHSGILRVPTWRPTAQYLQLLASVHDPVDAGVFFILFPFFTVLRPRRETFSNGRL